MVQETGAATDLFALFGRGGPIMYLILFASIYGTALAVERYLFYRRNAEELNNASAIVDTQPDSMKQDSIAGRLYREVMEQQGSSREAIVERARATFMAESASIEKHLGAVGVIATILPMIGLLGTVAGMIEAFDAIAIYGTGDPKILAGGISKALLTTAAGLITSIPLLYFHQLLSDQADRLVRSTDELLTHIFHIRFGTE